MTATATRLKTELMKVEEQYWNAIKANDAAGLGKLTADSFTYVMGDGVMNFNRNAFVEMMTQGDFKLNSYKFEEGGETVREIGPGIAAIAYKVQSVYQLEGKSHKAESFNSTIWAKKGDSWECLLKTESLIKHLQ